VSIALQPEHEALADSVAGLCARYADTSTTRAAQAGLTAGELPPVWKLLREQGFLTLHLPEDAGGDGAGMTELCVLLEAAGRTLVPGPLVPTLLTGALISAFGSAEQQRRWLPRLVDGAPAATATATSGLIAQRQGTGWTVSGLSEPVLGALAATTLVLGADSPDGAVWFLIDPEAGGLQRHRGEGVDVTRDIGRFELTALRVDEAAVLAVTTGQLHAVAGLLFAAEAAGLARWCQQTGLAYVKVREQFGKPVGSFQAIKHKCARLFIEAELMGASVWDAAGAADEGPEQFALAAACAAQMCLPGAVDLALDTITLLGGIGYTWEHDTHLYWRRAISLAALLGPRAPRSVALGRLALTAKRAATVELGEEPAGFRPRIAELLTHAAALNEPDRRHFLADCGLVAPQYPQPYGLDANAVMQVIIAEEFARAGLRQPSMSIGDWALPTILVHGTDAQRERFLPRTIRGDIEWCQLFSEPGAGSDLASLKTKAERADGGYVLNGQKVWTSHANEADWGICLARTDPAAPKHQGITYFLVDMRTPGVEVRPLREANGGYLFNEVFFSDVFVPDECVVGEPNTGWRLARTTLGNERVSLGTGMRSERVDLAGLARPHVDQAPDVVLSELAALTARTYALEALSRRALLRALSGLQPDAGASVLKVVAAAQVTEVARTVLGWQSAAAAVADGPAGAATHAYLSTPPQLIGGGTTEIQLNVISEQVLGLPRG
jgi:alkylation response protein AidB-like acyl-CoA dehydrogenase